MAGAIGELPRQLAGRTMRICQAAVDPALANQRANAIPVAPGCRRLGREPCVALRLVAPIPGVEGRPIHPQLLQRLAHREIRPFDQPNDLALLRPGQAHVSSSESEAVTLFLSRRFSSTVSASTCFSRAFSSRSVFTSGAVASRVVSPSSRFFPASRNSLLQR